MVKAVILPKENEAFSDFGLGVLLGSPFNVVNKTLVHATNPNNVDSILQLGKLVPNAEFKKYNIQTPIALAYPSEDPDERINDSYIHFANPFSTVPESAINLHTERKGTPDVFYDIDASPPFDIGTIRFYFNKEKFCAYENVSQIKGPNLPHNRDFYMYQGLFDISDALEAIIIPEDFPLPKYNPFKEKTIIVKGLIMPKNYGKYFGPLGHVAAMNYAYYKVASKRQS